MKVKELKPNVACLIVYVEKSNTNRYLNEPKPINRAKFAKLVHQQRLLGIVKIDSIDVYKVLVD